jgi:hypothetical protein
LKPTIFLKIAIGCFIKHPELRKRDCTESRETGRRLHRVAELRKSKFEGPQSQFRNFFSPQVRNRFGSPQYCGIAEVQTKIADAHLWLTVSLTTPVSLRQLNVRKINKPSWSKAGELTIFDGFKMWRILNNNHETFKLSKINQKQ